MRDKFTEARLQTAVAPSTFSFSTTKIGRPPSESRAVTFFAGFSMPLSTLTISSSS